MLIIFETRQESYGRTTGDPMSVDNRYDIPRRSSVWQKFTTVWEVAATVWEIAATVREIAATVWEIATTVWEIATTVLETTTTVWEITTRVGEIVAYHTVWEYRIGPVDPEHRISRQNYYLENF